VVIGQLGSNLQGMSLLLHEPSASTSAGVVLSLVKDAEQ